MKSWEAKLMENVGAKIGWDLVQAFSGQMRCLPEDAARGAEILIEKLVQSGLQPVVHKPEIYLGIPVSASIRTEHLDIECKASALSPEVANLTAPLLHLKAKPFQQGVHPGDLNSLFETGFATEEDVITAVNGKIVLTEGLSNPSRTQLLQSWGAVAVIVINPGKWSHWGTNSVIWGSPLEDELSLLPKIASVAVSQTQGHALREAASRGEYATLNVDALHGWFEQPVVTAKVSGEGPEAEDFVLLHSHYDSWEYGVGDNATGNAVVLEVARVLANSPAPLRRSVRFAWWPGHSAGRYAGSSWYADAFGPEMTRHCIAHVNCDSPGCKNATSYENIRSMAEAGPLLKRTVKDLFGQDCSITRPGRAGDYSFNNLGISGTLLTSSMIPKKERDRRGYYAVGGCGGNPAWHSEFDTLDVADRHVLENDVRLYTLVVARLAGENRVPLDYIETINEIRRHIAELAPERLGDDVALAIDAELAGALDRLEVLRVAPYMSDPDWNAMLRRLSRILVRLNYAVGPAHTQDPAKAFSPIPCLSGLSDLGADPPPAATLATLRARNAIFQHLTNLNELLRRPPYLWQALDLV